MKIIKFFMIFMLLASQLILATDYFVDGDEVIGNSNNSGLNETDPFLTISQAIEILESGDTVNIKGYDNIYYDEELNLNNLEGYSDEKITFKSYGGKMAIIRGDRYTNPSAINPDNPEENEGKGQITITGSQHIVIDGLKVINSAYAGIFIGDFDYSKSLNEDNAYYEKNVTTNIYYLNKPSSSNISIKNCIIHDTYSSGIGVWTSSDINISDNNITGACNGGGQESITVAHTINTEVSKNNISDNGGETEALRGKLGGEGIDIKHGSQDIKVFDNTVKNLVKRTGIYVDAWGQERDDNGNPIELKVLTTRIEIYNNRVSNCLEAGLAIASERRGELSHVRVFNNIISNNLYGGIEIGGWKEKDKNISELIEDENISNIKIYNNTVYKNGTGQDENGLDLNAGGIVISKDEIEHIFIFNNIISENGGYQIDYDENVSNVDGLLYDKVFINRNIMYRDENYENITKLYNFDDESDFWNDWADNTNIPSEDAWSYNPELNTSFIPTGDNAEVITKVGKIIDFIQEDYAPFDINGKVRATDCIDLGAIQVSDCP